MKKILNIRVDINYINTRGKQNQNDSFKCLIKWINIQLDWSSKKRGLKLLMSEMNKRGTINANHTEKNNTRREYYYRQLHSKLDALVEMDKYLERHKTDTINT